MADDRAIGEVVNQLRVLKPIHAAIELSGNMRQRVKGFYRETFTRMFRDRLFDQDDIIGAEYLRRSKEGMTTEETAAILGIAREWNPTHPYTVALENLPRDPTAPLRALPFGSALSMLPSAESRFAHYREVAFAAAKIRDVTEFQFALFVVLHAPWYVSIDGRPWEATFEMFLAAMKEEGPESETATFIAYNLLDCANLRGKEGEIQTLIRAGAITNLVAAHVFVNACDICNQAILVLEDTRSPEERDAVANTIEQLIARDPVYPSRPSDGFFAANILANFSGINELITKTRRDSLSRAIARVLIRCSPNLTQWTYAWKCLWEIAISCCLFDVATVLYAKFEWIRPLIKDDTLSSAIEKMGPSDPDRVDFAVWSRTTIYANVESTEFSMVLRSAGFAETITSSRSFGAILAEVPSAAMVYDDPVSEIMERAKDVAFHPFSTEESDRILSTKLASANKTRNICHQFLEKLVETILAGDIDTATRQVVAYCYYWKDHTSLSSVAVDAAFELKFTEALAYCAEKTKSSAFLMNELCLLGSRIKLMSRFAPREHFYAHADTCTIAMLMAIVVLPKSLSNVALATWFLIGFNDSGELDKFVTNLRPLLNAMKLAKLDVEDRLSDGLITIFKTQKLAFLANLMLLQACISVTQAGFLKVAGFLVDSGFITDPTYFVKAIVELQPVVDKDKAVDIYGFLRANFSGYLTDDQSKQIRGARQDFGLQASWLKAVVMTAREKSQAEAEAKRSPEKKRGRK